MTKPVQQTRRPRLRRVPDRPAMALTSRDVAIVEAVYEHRFLRRDQIAELFFPASEAAQASTLVSSCNARLQRLFQHGYLDRQMPLAPDGSTQAVYALDRAGAALIAGAHGIDPARLRWSPRRRQSEAYFREHTLAVNDVWVAFETAARGRANLRLIDWAMDGPEVWDSVPDDAGPRRTLPVRPDASFRLGFAERVAWFFLEVDRGTMTNRRFAEKVRAYQLYWRSGRFTDRYGARSFRVLTVAPGPRRRDNLRRTAARQEARGMFLFATLAELREGRLFEPIWYVPHRDELQELTA